MARGQVNRVVADIHHVAIREEALECHGGMSSGTERPNSYVNRSPPSFYNPARTSMIHCSSTLCRFSMPPQCVKYGEVT